MAETFDRFALEDMIENVTKLTGKKPKRIWITAQQRRELEESIFLIGHVAEHIVKFDGVEICVDKNLH